MYSFLHDTRVQAAFVINITSFIGFNVFVVGSCNVENSELFSVYFNRHLMNTVSVKFINISLIRVKILEHGAA